MKSPTHKLPWNLDFNLKNKQTKKNTSYFQLHLKASLVQSRTGIVGGKVRELISGNTLPNSSPGRSFNYS